MLKKIGTVLLLTVMTLAMLLPQQQVEASSKVYVQSQVNGLNVRSAGTLSGKVIGKINKGQQLQRTGSKGAWIRVNYKGKSGWIATKYLRTVKKTVAKASVKTYTMNASAYTPYCKGCSGVTALGWNVRAQKRNVVAVDPRVSPLGKKVQVYVGGKLMGGGAALGAGPLGLLFGGGSRLAETAQLARQFEIPIQMKGRFQHAAERAGVSVDEVMNDTRGRFRDLLGKAPLVDPRQAESALKIQNDFKDAIRSLQDAMTPLLQVIAPLVSQTAQFVQANAGGVRVLGAVALGIYVKRGIWAFDESEPLPAGVFIERNPNPPIPPNAPGCKVGCYWVWGTKPDGSVDWLQEKPTDPCPPSCRRDQHRELTYGSPAPNPGAECVAIPSPLREPP
jgi:uncharacterized protein YraI